MEVGLRGKKLRGKKLRSKGWRGSDPQSAAGPRCFLGHSANSGCDRLAWLSRIVKIYKQNENDVEKLAGQEVVIYLAFLKYSFIMFLTIFFLCGLPLMIMYIVISYEANLERFNSPINRITIEAYLNNSKDSNILAWIMFLFYVMTVSLGHCQLYFLENKMKEVH